MDARIAAPRCSAAQLGDCPPDFCSGPRHLCSHANPCTPWSAGGSSSPLARSSDISSPLAQLNPDAAVFIPAPPPLIFRLDPLDQVFLPKKAGTAPRSDTALSPVFYSLNPQATVFVPSVHRNDMGKMVTSLLDSLSPREG